MKQDMPSSDHRPSANYSYEIVMSNIDGGEIRRLTQNEHFDNYPVWSPDGTRLAFISDRDRGGGSWTTKGTLTILTIATGESTELELSIGKRVAAYPPVWSPDGEEIAFIANEEQFPPTVYIVNADGSGLRRISSALSVPSWSPDGERIALVAPTSDGGTTALQTFARDGSDRVSVAAVGAMREYEHRLGSVYWSPEGDRILEGDSGKIFHLDGSSDTESWIDGRPLKAVWSPDGSRIAVRRWASP